MLLVENLQGNPRKFYRDIPANSTGKPFELLLHKIFILIFVCATNIYFFVKFLPVFPFLASAKRLKRLQKAFKNILFLSSSFWNDITIKKRFVHRYVKAYLLKGNKMFSSYHVQLLVARNLNGLSLIFEDLKIEIRLHKVIDPFLLHQKKGLLSFSGSVFFNRLCDASPRPFPTTYKYMVVETVLILSQKEAWKSTTLSNGP